jgi:hypothetical protein
MQILHVSARLGIGYPSSFLWGWSLNFFYSLYWIDLIWFLTLLLPCDSYGVVKNKQEYLEIWVLAHVVSCLSHFQQISYLLWILVPCGTIRALLAFSSLLLNLSVPSLNQGSQTLKNINQTFQTLKIYLDICILNSI